MTNAGGFDLHIVSCNKPLTMATLLQCVYVFLFLKFLMTSVCHEQSLRVVVLHLCCA